MKKDATKKSVLKRDSDEKKGEVCSLSHQGHSHPSHREVLPRLKRVQGQVAAVGRMVVAHEYCPNILQQIRAATSALKAIETMILKNHMESCVKDAMTTKDKAQVNKKIQELIWLLKRTD